MPKHQRKNKIIIIKQVIMGPPEPNYPMAARPEYSNAAEVQENDHENNLVKMREVLLEEMKNSL